MTKENKTYFVRMSLQGFKILGDVKDVENMEDGPVYESIQALLTQESPEYRRIFSETLVARLNELDRQDS